MAGTHSKFYLDKQNAKYKGVCAGIADYTGIDVVWVRVATVLFAFAAQGWPIIAYFVAAWVAPRKPIDLYLDQGDQKFWQGVRQSPTRTAKEVRSRFRDIDRRLADMEVYYTSKNTRLADEIESLR